MMYCSQCDNCSKENTCCNVPTIDVITMLDYISNHDLSKHITVIGDDGTVFPLSECSFFNISNWTEEEIEEIYNAESNAMAAAMHLISKTNINKSPT